MQVYVWGGLKSTVRGFSCNSPWVACVLRSVLLIYFSLASFLHKQQQIYDWVCAKDNKKRHFSFLCIFSFTFYCNRFHHHRHRFRTLPHPTAVAAVDLWTAQLICTDAVCSSTGTPVLPASVSNLFTFLCSAPFIWLLVFRVFYCCFLSAFAAQLLLVFSFVFCVFATIL